MRAQFVFPVLAAILILGIFGSAQDVFAPKKLFVGGLSWDSIPEYFNTVEKKLSSLNKFFIAPPDNTPDPTEAQRDQLRAQLADIKAELTALDDKHKEWIEVLSFRDECPGFPGETEPCPEPPR